MRLGRGHTLSGLSFSFSLNTANRFPATTMHKVKIASMDSRLHITTHGSTAVEGACNWG